MCRGGGRGRVDRDGTLGTLGPRGRLRGHLGGAGLAGARQRHPGAGQGLRGKSGSAASKAFVADAQLTRLTRLIRLTGQGVGTLSGDTRVRSSLEPGTYDVSVTCDGKEHKARGTITVGENGKPAATEPGPPKPDATKPDATKPEAAEPAASARPSAPASPASPVAPARAGGGGAADQVATSQGAADPVDSMDDARHTGPGARHAVVGLVLAGVAAVVVVARGVRRSRRRGTE